MNMEAIFYDPLSFSRGSFFFFVQYLPVTYFKTFHVIYLFMPPAAIYCSTAFGLCNDLNQNFEIFSLLSFFVWLFLNQLLRYGSCLHSPDILTPNYNYMSQ